MLMDSRSSPASIRCCWTRRASSLPSTSTRPAGRRTRSRSCDACRRLHLPAALERSRSGRGRPRVAVLRRGHAGRTGAAAGLAPAHRSDGGPAGHRPGLVRPPLSQPGHDAAGRIRKPDRLAAAEARTRSGQQRLSRRRPRAVGRPVGVSCECAPDQPSAGRSHRPGSRATRPDPRRASAAGGR